MIEKIILALISFMLGLFTREIREFFKKKKQHNKVKPLNEQDFKKAMKDLEIK